MYISMANAIRGLSMDAVEAANSGHPGMPMGMADVATILFSEYLNHCPEDPRWPNRDRFILSAGHGSMLLYSLYYMLGYPEVTLEDIQQFRQLGSKTAGHPEFGEISAIETTTGPLGQGLANGVGMAIAETSLASRFGHHMIDHFTYVIVGDGCLMEGISHEAMSLAGHLRLSKMVVLWDDNSITIDGSTDLSVSEDTLERVASYGWDVMAIDGHDHQQIRKALSKAKEQEKPTFIACRTTIGYGAPQKGGTASCHGAPLGSDEVTRAKKILKLNPTPFSIAEDVLENWRMVGKRCKDIHEAWKKQHKHEISERKFEFNRLLEGKLPEGWRMPLETFKSALLEEPRKEATRVSSGKVLQALSSTIPELFGGSADLSGSNGTKIPTQLLYSKEDRSGTYLHYGVREHAMGAIMNGIALYKGLIPYGGTFLVFSDYCRPAIRLSALMKQRVIYVMTHDSIGLGEDGPTHQPVEHVASLRAIPNLMVFRPADAIETAECWEIALESETTPSVLALTRQSVGLVRDSTLENVSRRGAYVLHEAAAEQRVTLFASGSEVELAVGVRQQLEKVGIGACVISVPCMELFNQQDSDYVISLLCKKGLKVAIEAGVRQGWDHLIGPHGLFVGMENFGASGPAPELYDHFGLNVEKISTQIQELLNGNKNRD